MFVFFKICKNFLYTNPQKFHNFFLSLYFSIIKKNKNHRNFFVYFFTFMENIRVKMIFSYVHFIHFFILNTTKVVITFN